MATVTNPRSPVAGYRRLSALASAPGAGAPDVVAAVAAVTGARVALVDRALRVLAASSHRSGDAGGDTGGHAGGDAGGDAAGEAAAVRERVRGPHRVAWAGALDAVGALGRAVRIPLPDGAQAVVAPVTPGEDVDSFLVAEYDPPADDEGVLLLVEHAAAVAGVLVGRDRVLTAAAGQVRADLVSGLLLGRARDPDHAARWAGHLGYETQVAHRVLLMTPEHRGAGDDDAPGSLLAEAEEHLRRDAPGALTVVRDAELAAVVPVEADPDAVGAACARRLARGRVPDPDARWPVAVALGGEVTDPADLARSYDQARRTLTAARRLGGPGRVLRFDDLGIHRLLVQIPDPGSARDFAREVLGGLVDDASDRAVDLRRTLARWFREDGSLQRTARVLSCHPNTVAYRLRRAEELSGLSLERYADRLAAQVALEILGEMAG